METEQAEGQYLSATDCNRVPDKRLMALAAVWYFARFVAVNADFFAFFDKKFHDKMNYEILNVCFDIQNQLYKGERI